MKQTTQNILAEALELRELMKRKVEFMKTPQTEADEIIARLQGYRPAPSKAYWVRWQ